MLLYSCHPSLVSKDYYFMMGEAELETVSSFGQKLCYFVSGFYFCLIEVSLLLVLE